MTDTSKKQTGYIKPNLGDEIVITGMSGKFPDSYNISNFAENLFNKADLVSGDYRRWKPIHSEVPQRSGKLFDIEKFDMGFFGVTSTQSDNMDPMIRLVLETTYEAIFDAGYSPSDFENTNTAVFVGSCYSETQKMTFHQILKPNLEAMTGTHRSMISRRISYALKLKGPSYIMDTACSSSLYALEQAYFKMIDGKCDKAIVCGANLCLHPMVSLQFSRLGVLSKDGACKSFDDAADGYARSEAIVSVILERGKDARRIYGEVVYAKTNCDGFKKEGITFASSDAQIMLMKDFYQECGVNPNELTFMEAHGTGTKVGDPEELTTIEEVVCKHRNRPLYIGTVKSNIGHTEPSSGLCAIVKIVIAMETGFIPPNINFTTPRQGIKSLHDGRLRVVTEKLPLPDQNGLFAVNNFGFGGANAHVLLHWNTRLKRNNGQPADDLPRVICVSSRVPEGIHSILDDFKAKNCDAEYAYLIQRGFRKTIQPFFYRGYGIYDKLRGEIKRSVGKYLEPKKLYLIFSNFDEDWVGIGQHLMKFPIFSETIQSIQEILTRIKFDEPNLNFQNKIITMVAVQIGLGHILKEMNFSPHHVAGIGTGEWVASYFDNYLSLKQVVSGLYYLAGNLKNPNREVVSKILMINGRNCDKWLPTNQAKFARNKLDYFIDNFDVSTNGKHLRKLIPNDAIALIIGTKINDKSTDLISLIDPDSNDHMLDVLANLGKLYQKGVDLELDKLYPKIDLPVSRGTPTVAPCIKWNHFKDNNVYLYRNEESIKSGFKIIYINAKNDDWNFITNHVIDGRNLFPAAGYLILAWECLAMTVGKISSEMKVVFEGVKFLRAVTVPKDGPLQLLVMIQTGTHNFQINEGEAVIVTGKLYELTDTNDHHVFSDIPIMNQNVPLALNDRDVYKELKLRGYHYSGIFRGIKGTNEDASQSIIEWHDNWISFIDCLLQLIILHENTRNLYIPVGIGQLIIDGPKHVNTADYCKNMLPAYSYKDLRLIRVGGIEIRGLDASAIPRRSTADPVLEVSKFIPNITKMDLGGAVRCLMQLIWENINAIKIKVVEVCTSEQNEDQLLCVMIQMSLDDLPLVQQDIMVLSDKPMDLPRIAVQNKPLSTESDCVILVVSNLLENIDLNVAMNVLDVGKGYIITREKLNVDLSKFSKISSLKLICSYNNNEETIILLKPRIKNVSENWVYLDLTNAVENLDVWLPKLQDLLKQNSNIVVYAQNDELSGLLGLSNCLKREPYGGKITCVFIVDEAPKFDPKLDFYKQQLNKKLFVNIWKNGAWGTYRHLLLPDREPIECESSYVSVDNKGDLSSITWLERESSEDDDDMEEDGELVHVYYGALNFRDLMTASGKISSEVMAKKKGNDTSIEGMEFVGRNSKGERVMGMDMNKSLSTVFKAKTSIPIPSKWTMEEAATITVVYSTVIEALLKDPPKRGETILIHSGTGGIGQAAINICHYYGLDIFITVGTQEKRDFIKEHYPQIKEDHIGNSRDTSFEDMVHKYTGGRGVDYVLNSLAEEKLLASVRCLARGGTFLEIGKFDLANNNTLALHLLEKEARFKSIALDWNVARSHDSVQWYRKMILDLAERGGIKPLPRTVFPAQDIEKAFRYMATGKHIGKIVIKIRDDEGGEISPVPRQLFKAMPRFSCKPKWSYLICGGLGGFGLELANFLILRGAKKLVLTSRSGVCEGYQKYRLSVWENYGVTVLTSTCQALTEESCTELINLAKKLGPVDVIFNLAAVLKDAIFENQTVGDFKVSLTPKAYCAQNLDSISRKLCPQLRHFVMFSSLSCGRGNAGQTNYGMANSIMERICEKRKSEGYPALAIQWGAIGEVGLVAKLQEDHRELVIGGTLQQRVSSCLTVMDRFLTQNEPIVASMLVAEKRYGGRADNLFDAVMNIMGITNLKTVSMHSTFPELGMDSITLVEVKQTLEREYEVYLTAQDIRVMTLTKLRDLSNSRESEVVPEQLLQEEIPQDIKMLIRHIGSEEFSRFPTLELKTLLEPDQDGPHIFALAGVEGMAASLEPLCRKLKAHVTCLQFCPQIHAETIKELAESVLPYIESYDGDLIFMAYSFGSVIALELLKILESKGREATVIFIDGTPEFMTKLVHAFLPADNKELFETMFLAAFMTPYMSYDHVIKNLEATTKFGSYQQKFEYIINLIRNVEISKKFSIEMALSGYRKVAALSKYKYEGNKIQSEVTLFKAKAARILEMPVDYGLSTHFENIKDVVFINGNHVSVLENDDLSQEINKILSVKAK